MNPQQFAKNTKLLKFIAQFPFEQIYIDGNKDNFCQIVAVHFAAQQVTLRDFCEYEMDEVIKFVFEDGMIQLQWEQKLKEYKH